MSDNVVNEELWQKAKKLAARDYKIEETIDTLEDGTQVYVVKNPELPGCMAYDEVRDVAIKELEEARIDYIYFKLVDGRRVPEPKLLSATTGTSGGSTFRPDITILSSLAEGGQVKNYTINKSSNVVADDNPKEKTSFKEVDNNLMKAN